MIHLTRTGICLFILVNLFFDLFIPFIVGEQSHLSRISFCVNTSATAPPPSPIPTSLPIRVYAQGKGWSSNVTVLVRIVFLQNFFQSSYCKDLKQMLIIDDYTFLCVLVESI